MSLQDRFREGLYDPKHKPRLAFARSYFLGFTDKDPDLQGLVEFYLDWRDFDEYLVLQKQIDNVKVKGEVEKETIAFKCAKRGNDQYWWRVWKRLKPLYNLKEHTLFDPHGSIKSTNILFATLTYDIQRSTIREAWETVGKDFNRWISHLRKNFGKFSYLRCWEGSQKGYPHVHVLMLFHYYQFKIAFSQLKKGRQIYRIEEKEAFEKSWHSFVDVQGIRKLREGIKYIIKYLSKTKYALQSQTLTLALCWLFKKRSFSVSGDFHKVIYAMTTIQYRLVQTDLFGKKIDVRVVWVFIGIFQASKLGIDHNEWRKVITDRKILDEILS